MLLIGHLDTVFELSSSFQRYSIVPGTNGNVATGPGVNDRARAHLFEAFQGSTRRGGSGLGLAIAAELIRAHGGEIRLVDGTIGATFRIIIPDRAVELGARRARA